MEYNETRDYKGYTITITQDTWSESPTTWGTFSISIFDSGFRGDLNTGKSRDEYYDDNDNLTIGMRSKLRAGTAFAISVAHYGNSDGGFYTIIDNASEADGFIEFEPDYIKGVSYDDRRKYAQQDVSIYQQWCNGEVYSYVITDEHGDTIDSLCGCYGNDVWDEAQSFIDSYTPSRDSVYAAKARALHV